MEFMSDWFVILAPKNSEQLGLQQWMNKESQRDGKMAVTEQTQLQEENTAIVTDNQRTK